MLLMLFRGQVPVRAFLPPSNWQCNIMGKNYQVKSLIVKKKKALATVILRTAQKIHKFVDKIF